jgi:hypothetical protein
MNSEEAARLDQLRNQPSLVDQGNHGCCGPAGTLMGLLFKAPDAVNDLCGCVFDGREFGAVAKSTKVRLRIERRSTASFIQTAENQLDAKLSIGLMLLLKEYLKQTGEEAVWQDCVQFSTNFEGWSYGQKLKEVLDDPQKLATMTFSYKQGSFALSIRAIEILLAMVGFQTETKGYTSGTLSSTIGNASALIGLTNSEFALKPELESWQHIAHWVCAPKLPADVNAANLWTWGMEGCLKDINEISGGSYRPVVAICFGGRR